MTPRGRAKIIGVSLEKQMGEKVMWVWLDGAKEPVWFKKSDLKPYTGPEGKTEEKKEDKDEPVVSDEKDENAPSKWSLSKFMSVVNNPSRWNRCDTQLVRMINDMAENIKCHPFHLLYTDFTSKIQSSRSLLKDLPLDQICARFEVLKYVNQITDRVLQHIDLHQHGVSEAAKRLTLGHQLTVARALVFTSVKAQLFRTLLFKTKSEPQIGRAVQQECRDRSRMPSSA
eukprot:TRINITY_DN23965_c0_g2_i1.p1 TRINITY_DN23965_c0_g2~~TRINITY_DN23965_c0_g2_i1.p1  ORF type:complete len:255 (+),score=49.77 TRINITY_DN23965_c0_g2_i1:83-766(+)